MPSRHGRRSSRAAMEPPRLWATLRCIAAMRGGSVRGAVRADPRLESNRLPGPSAPGGSDLPVALLGKGVAVARVASIESAAEPADALGAGAVRELRFVRVAKGV